MIWAASFLLVLASAIALASAPSWWMPMCAAAGIGFIAEQIGVRTGFPFGHYRFTDVLRPSAGGVPILVAGAWMVMFAYVSQMRVHPALAAAWMAALETIIEPVASNELGYWQWLQDGAYYGVPPVTFGGWFAVGLIIILYAQPLSAATQLIDRNAGTVGNLFLRRHLGGASLSLSGFLRCRFGGSWILEIQVLERFDDDVRDGQIAEPFVIGRYHEPGRVLLAGLFQGVLIGLLVLIPELALPLIGCRTLPVLIRILVALVEPAFLLFFADVQEEFQNRGPVLRKKIFERVDLVIALRPDFLRNQIMHAND
jgi:Carotenoid biosynthesis protein